MMQICVPFVQMVLRNSFLYITHNIIVFLYLYFFHYLQGRGGFSLFFARPGDLSLFYFFHVLPLHVLLFIVQYLYKTTGDNMKLKYKGNEFKLDDFHTDCDGHLEEVNSVHIKDYKTETWVEMSVELFNHITEIDHEFWEYIQELHYKNEDGPTIAPWNDPSGKKHGVSFI